MAFIESKDLHEYHVIATEKCLNEFEALTAHDADFNIDYKWIESDIRNIYSGYLILNQQDKENNKLTFNEKLKIIINPSEFLKERISNNILEQFKYAKKRYSFSSPIDLLKSTVFNAFQNYYLYRNKYFFRYINGLIQYLCYLVYYFDINTYGQNIDV